MRDRNVVWAIVLTALLAMLAAVYWYVDPMEAGWMPRCMWKVATGTDCPGCGMQRMAHALMHGDIGMAWRANAYALCALPFIAALVLLEIFRERYQRLYRKVHTPGVIWCIGGSVLAWWVLRNVL